MDCDQARPLIYAHLTDTLEHNLNSLLERHLDSCETCCAILRAYGEKMADMACAFPQVQAAERVRRALFARIDDSLGRTSLYHRSACRIARFFGAIRNPPLTRMRTTALLLGMTILLAGFWFSQGPNPDTADLESPLPSLGSLASENTRLLERQGTATAIAKLVSAEQYDPYYGLGISPASGASLTPLRGSTAAAGASGMLISSKGEAILLALNLPPLPSNKVYQVWLVKAGDIVDLGILSIDATGYGQAVFIPYPSLTEYEGIGITVEPAGGSGGPTGESVLQGDL